MFSPYMVSLYKRLLALGMLCACLAAPPTLTGTVFAAGCIEQCMDTEAQCSDNCADECSSSDTACGSCIETCATRFNSCTMGKVICAGSGGGTTYTPSCQTEYSNHCPVINSITHCDDPSAHAGYYQLCNNAPGGGQCVTCPDHEYCTGSGGLPPCL